VKRCTKCKKPGEFYKDKSTKDGLTLWCKGCCLKKTKCYQRENVDVIRVRKKKYYADHRQDWHDRHVRTYKSKRKPVSAEEMEARAARERAYNKTYMAAYRKKHHEHLKAQARRRKKRTGPSAWDVAHPEKMQQYKARWRRANPAKMLVLDQRRRARMAIVENTLTHAEWLEILEVFDHRCAYCNQKGLKLTMEHVIAISRGGGHTKENVVPACGRHNSKKHTKPVFMMAQAA
jgi:hypothetical protein